jgi:predicted nucleotidyltransferase component of viral defense system
LKQEIKPLSASVHARLRQQARAAGRPFQEYLQYYGMERFLYRLAQSRYRDDFVLKGAAAFFAWGISLRRSTRYIDLLGYTASTVENLERITRDICLQPAEEDGLSFDPDSVVGEITQLGAQYQGVRIRFRGYLGRARIPMQVDVGFGDRITPAKLVTDYPVMLAGLPSPRLSVYSHETLIAEKLQIMVSLGEINSRMKDFYDIWVLARQRDFDGDILTHAIRQTFSDRKTPVPQGNPVAFTDTYAAAQAGLWSAFLHKNGLDPAELGDFRQVICAVSAFLVPPLHAVARGESFDTVWKMGHGWLPH